MTLISHSAPLESVLIDPANPKPRLDSKSSFTLTEKDGKITNSAPFASLKPKSKDTVKILDRDATENEEPWKKVIVDYEEEFLNAITMLAPVVVSINFMPQCTDSYSMAIAIHTFLHTPFSMLHHFNLALKDPYRGQVGRGLIFRRLDYTFIHVSCTLLTYGLARSEVFGLLAAVFNSYAIYKIWTNPKRPQRPSHSLQGIGVLMYISMLLLHGQFYEFLACFGTFFLCFFVYKLGKKVEKTYGHGLYCHPIMHVLLALPQFFMHVGHPEVNKAFTQSW
mmetsp:Transcript_25792/g.33813  ORF Transcript_25792/g.33813 Transcript_25792/m.33813 type:complete len:279 (-) Transcript_25792:511-1347(-)|eukprot:CAMPEP_0117745960 /NCGR_PEP_ID=MMETSP0947-20121206/7673_1 /TAXON_ID=44440 /ORGANISM="Chattonella subsalsa, Strain CCMP2191" /LENGTH=278 /DNA_ID=CAMNT_0005563215 /DNA_START=147 /DNA_END=983 /DNA_ORIENTATION=-